MVKIISLGNEFIKNDSLAKKVGELLKKDYEVIALKDSFQLMGIISEGREIVILDVVEGFKEVGLIKVSELRNDTILSAHDFDASYVLSLSGKDIKIIGIPMEGEVEEILLKVRKLIPN